MNKLDMLSTVVCGSSIILGVLAYKGEVSYIELLCFIIIVILNVYFVLKMIAKLLEMYTVKFEEKINAHLLKLSVKFPWIKKLVRIRVISK